MGKAFAADLSYEFVLKEFSSAVQTVFFDYPVVEKFLGPLETAVGKLEIPVQKVFWLAVFDSLRYFTFVLARYSTPPATTASFGFDESTQEKIFLEIFCSSKIAPHTLQPYIEISNRHDL